MRRVLLVVLIAAAVSAPAGAQPDSTWTRHRGDGFAVSLPSSWADTSKDRARLLRDIRRLAGDDPELAAIMDGLLSAGNSNVAVKMIAFDLAPSTLHTGFATNLNVVKEKTSVNLATWRRAAERALTELSFIVQPIWSKPVRLPAGKAVRFTYKARFTLGTRRIVTVITQYALLKGGAAIVFTYTTLPRLSAAYRPTFEQSARSIRLG